MAGVVKARGFPWLSHRTPAQVRRTDELMRRRDAGERLLDIEAHELALLLAKAVRHNPPPGRPGDAA